MPRDAPVMTTTFCREDMVMTLRGVDAAGSHGPATELLAQTLAGGGVMALLHSGVLRSHVEIAQAPLQRRAV